MKKEFIVPSLEVKMFSRVCEMTDSAVTQGSNVDDAKAALTKDGVDVANIKVLTI
jgi:hypothetical protein